MAETGGEPQRSHFHSGGQKSKGPEDEAARLPPYTPAWQDLHLPTQNGCIYPVCKAFGWKDLQYLWKEKRKPNKLQHRAAQHKPSAPVTGNRLFIAEDH